MTDSILQTDSIFQTGSVEELLVRKERNAFSPLSFFPLQVTETNSG